MRYGSSVFLWLLSGPVVLTTEDGEGASAFSPQSRLAGTQLLQNIWGPVN